MKRLERGWGAGVCVCALRFSGSWNVVQPLKQEHSNGQRVSAWMLARIILYDCVVSEWSRASGDYIISTVWVKS